MSKIFHQPTRMCISCRERDMQNNLYRLQCADATLNVFNGYGRSFYICKNCICQEKKVIKAIMRQCRSSDKDKFTNKLKEIIADDRKS
jgi:predicted RNA-binding protein YlxR (DUF448 family)